MSFSITAQGKTRAAAAALASFRLAEQLKEQSMHFADRKVIHAALDGAIAAVDEPREGEQVNVSAHGSASGYSESAVTLRVTGCSFTVNVNVSKVPAPVEATHQSV